ncbi:ANTR protein, partial [Crotophaga sulcirostris]|nr:ANTR protein [Crotophaga sulcirostris]
MKVKLSIGFVLALAATTCLCRPAAEAPGAAGDPHPIPSWVAWHNWPHSLSQEEQQKDISHFLPRIYTVLGDHQGYEQGAGGALQEHYYPDWLDFGRRSVEDAADAA